MDTDKQKRLNINEFNGYRINLGLGPCQSEILLLLQCALEFMWKKRRGKISVYRFTIPLSVKDADRVIDDSMLEIEPLISDMRINSAYVWAGKYIDMKYVPLLSEFHIALILDDKKDRNIKEFLKYHITHLIEKQTGMPIEDETIYPPLEMNIHCRKIYGGKKSLQDAMYWLSDMAGTNTAFRQCEKLTLGYTPNLELSMPPTQAEKEAWAELKELQKIYTYYPIPPKSPEETVNIFDLETDSEKALRARYEAILKKCEEEKRKRMHPFGSPSFPIVDMIFGDTVD